MQGTAAPVPSRPERAAAAAGLPAAEAADTACTDGRAGLCDSATSGGEAASAGVQGGSCGGGDNLALLPAGITTYTEARALEQLLASCRKPPAWSCHAWLE